MAHSSHTKKQCFYRFVQLAITTGCKKTVYNAVQDSQWFFLPDGKNTRLSKIVNTWTFDRLTPNGNEGVCIQIDYLECAYGTRYYIVDKINGEINAIHDDSLELTEFKGCFSPIDLDKLESKVCKLLAGNQYDEDMFDHQDDLQGCDPI